MMSNPIDFMIDCLNAQLCCSVHFFSLSPSPLKTCTLLIHRAHSLSKSNNYAVCSCVDVHSPLSFSFSTRFNEFSAPVFLSDTPFFAVGKERHLFLLIWGEAKGLMLNTTFPPLLAVTRIIDDGFTFIKLQCAFTQSTSHLSNQIFFSSPPHFGTFLI